MTSTPRLARWGMISESTISESTRSIFSRKSTPLSGGTGTYMICAMSDEPETWFNATRSLIASTGV